MPKVKLTKKVIDALPQASNPKGELYYDQILSGFGIAVYPTGRKSFFINYGPVNKRRRLKLGAYGILTLEQARQLAREKLVGITGGQDPLEERKARQTATTFGEWVDEYLKRVRLLKKSPREDVRYLTIARELWGKQALDSIKTEDIERVFHDKAQEVSKTTANRWLASVRACLQDAWRKDKIPQNPAMKVRVFPENAGRTRVLSDDELVRTLKAIDTLDDPHTRAAFHLLVQTGARKSEVLRAKWEDVDLKQRLWRIPTTKAGKPQIMPLPPETVAMLEHLPRVGSYIVPGKDGKRQRYDLKGPWKLIQDAAGIKDVTIHDVRRTFGLHIARKAGLHVASKLLRHSDIRVTEKHYAPLGLEELRTALDQRGADVVEMGKKRRKIMKCQPAPK
jgi:integrase